MSLIFYSVMGEGRGHAARARAMVEALRARHDLVLYASFDALEFLSREYGDDPAVQVREIPGVRFHYTGGRLDNWKSICEGLAFWRGCGKAIEAVAHDIHRDKPDLMVSDFEAVAPRAARRCGVPVLALDHQHFMLAYDLSPLPRRLRRWAWLMGLAVRMVRITPERLAVSAFYKPPLKAGWEAVVQLGPLLRPAVRQRRPEVGGHVLTYLRKATPPRVPEMLGRLGVPVKIYGLGEREPTGDATFHAISEEGFLEDLATCDCVIAAAGNQLLGEALYFRKPVFALPEWNHFEQCINACFLKDLGGGDWAPLEKVDEPWLREFLASRETYRHNLASSEETFDGNADAVAAIEAMLPQPANEPEASVTQPA